VSIAQPIAARRRARDSDIARSTEYPRVLHQAR
jgi:hypothetical protein